MRGVNDGKKFEENYINENGNSGEILIDQIDSNGYNTYCNDSYLNNKYYMQKTYENGKVIDTRTDGHRGGIGQGKLKIVKIIGKKE